MTRGWRHDDGHHHSARRPVHRHDSDTVHRRDPGGELGSPGNLDRDSPVTYTRGQRFLRFDPTDPVWPNRDRFVLSSGHASALPHDVR